MDPGKITAVMRDLALEAGTAIMEVYQRDSFEVATKADDSPVTEADLAADALIYAGLTTLFPDIPVVTEERVESHAISDTRFFIVDPLDGTKEFIKRRGEFTVNIALVVSGVPRFGVVYAPAIGRLFWTDATGQSVEETGRHEQGTVGDLHRISVSSPENSALTVVASKSHRDAVTDDYIAKYRVAKFSSAGSSLKFCLVATGEADLYPRLGRTMEWDTAAGHAVLLGAGGRMVCFDDHSPFVYGKPGYENPFFIACAPGVALKEA